MLKSQPEIHKQQLVGVGQDHDSSSCPYLMAGSESKNRALAYCFVIFTEEQIKRLSYKDFEQSSATVSIVFKSLALPLPCWSRDASPTDLAPACFAPALPLAQFGDQ